MWSGHTHINICIMYIYRHKIFNLLQIIWSNLSEKWIRNFACFNFNFNDFWNRWILQYNKILLCICEFDVEVGGFGGMMLDFNFIYYLKTQFVIYNYWCFNQIYNSFVELKITEVIHERTCKF